MFSNRWIILGVTAQAVAQLAITYLPVMNTVFGTAPIGVGAWLRIFGSQWRPASSSPSTSGCADRGHSSFPGDAGRSRSTDDHRTNASPRGGPDDEARRCTPAHVPIPDRPAPGLTTYDAKDPDTTYPPIEPLLPPEGAPNVLVVLLDDVGFGASSAFGGPCHTPTAERLAAGGLRYNRFHTTALCAPTRQALLTGRNHHSVGMGSITETATSAPGNSSLRPNTKAPVAMTLKLNGYSTAQFGKCHEVPVWQSSPMGPFDAWPSGGGGFETFYGFIGGENNQWDPALYDGTTPVEPPATPEEGYHLTEDLADQRSAGCASRRR